MAKRRDRSPHPPRIYGDLEAPDVLTQVLLQEEGRHTDLAMGGLDLAETKARGIELECFSLTDVDLHASVLDHLSLTDGKIHGSDWANLRSNSCSMSRVEFVGCRFTGAHFAEGGFHDVLFRDCRIDLASFRFSHFNRVRFEACQLRECDFQGIKSRASTFVDSDLSGAQISQADLTGTAFKGCKLEGLRGLNSLKGAEMTWPDMMELTGAFAATLGITINEAID